MLILSTITVIEDWHFGSTLAGTFYVFDSTGNALVTKELTANLLESMMQVWLVATFYLLIFEVMA